MANGRYGRIAASASRIAAAGTLRRSRCHIAISNTGAVATMVVRATIKRPPTSAALRQCSRATSHANSARPGQYGGVWAIDEKPVKSGLMAIEPRISSALAVAAYRPVHAD